MQWFRVYNEILDDPKVAKMDGETFRCFIFFLAISSEQETEGTINMSVPDISWRIRVPIDVLEMAISYLLRNNILKKEKDSFIITNWKKRQFASDNVGIRVKRFREKQGNVSSNVTCNVVDTDTDTEKKKKERVASASSPVHKIKYLDSVMLSETEYKKLQEVMGQKNLENGIEQLDYSITVKGGKYKNHYKVLLNWLKRGFISGSNGDVLKQEKPKVYHEIDPETIMERQRKRDEVAI